MYKKKATEEELKAFGLKESDYLEESIMVWRENFEAVRLFIQLSTQWRVSMGGVTGLDYSAIRALFKIQGIKKKNYKQLMEDLAILEAAALDEMHKD